MKVRAECKDRKEFGNIGSARKSLPVGKLNGTSADDLFPLFDRYGKVVDIFIPRDRRTGESRGFAFVRYKHADEAQKAIERLDGRNVDGRDIVVQYAKYGRNDEAIHRGKITQGSPKWRSRSRSRSPRRTSRRYRDDCSEKLFSRRSRSHSQDRSDRGRQRERIRNESYRRGNRSGTQSSVSRSRSRSMSDQQGEHHARSLFEKPSSVRSKSQGPHGCSASPSPSHTRSFSVHSRSSQDGALQVTMNGNPSATELMSTGMELKFPVMSREARPLGACSIGCQSIPLAGRTASPSYDHQSPEQ